MQQLSRRSSISNLSSMNLAKSSKCKSPTKKETPKTIVEKPSEAPLENSTVAPKEQQPQGHTIYYFCDKKITRDDYYEACEAAAKDDYTCLSLIYQRYPAPKNKRDRNM